MIGDVTCALVSSVAPCEQVCVRKYVVNKICLLKYYLKQFAASHDWVVTSSIRSKFKLYIFV